jgi:RNA polymerase sigma factor (sigma-70 family)
MDKKNILNEIKNGNQQVINELYKQYRNPFLSFAYSKFNLDIDLAKEIYQDAFVAFYQNVTSGRLTVLTADLKTYIFQIGKNLINNELRKDKKIDKSTELSKIKITEDNNNDDDENKYEQMQKAIKEAIKQLSDICYMLLTKYYFEKMKYEELMKTLNYKNIESIKTQKYKCLRKLEIIIKAKYNKEDLLS